MIWPGALKLAASMSNSRQSSATFARSSPMIAAMPPVVCSQASCISRPRSATTRKPGRKIEDARRASAPSLRRGSGRARTRFTRREFPLLSQRRQQRQPVHEQRRLADLGLGQLGFGTFEADLRQIPAQHAVRLVVERARRRRSRRRATCPCRLFWAPCPAKRSASPIWNRQS